jgi:trans-aconitate methyltransferase
MSAQPATGGETAGGWNAQAYGRNARFVADMAASLIDWLDPQAGERILDLGCGDGVMSRRIVERGADVLGVDSSPAFVAAAREQGIAAVQGDGQALSANSAIAGPFDAVFSNAALHWMHRDPDAVIAGVYTLLRPGGRFVAEFGGAGNIAPIRAALREQAQVRGKDADALDPWFFPEENTYMDQLRAAGFSIEGHKTFERPTPLPGDLSGWLETLARPFVHAFASGAARDDYIAAVVAQLAPVMRQADGSWVAPYVRLRFLARKPKSSIDK